MRVFVCCGWNVVVSIIAVFFKKARRRGRRHSLSDSARWEIVESSTVRVECAARDKEIGGDRRWREIYFVTYKFLEVSSARDSPYLQAVGMTDKSQCRRVSSDVAKVDWRAAPSPLVCPLVFGARARFPRGYIQKVKNSPFF